MWQQAPIRAQSHRMDDTTVRITVPIYKDTSAQKCTNTIWGIVVVISIFV